MKNEIEKQLGQAELLELQACMARAQRPQQRKMVSAEKRRVFAARHAAKPVEQLNQPLRQKISYYMEARPAGTDEIKRQLGEKRKARPQSTYRAARREEAKSFYRGVAR